MTQIFNKFELINIILMKNEHPFLIEYIITCNYS